MNLSPKPREEVHCPNRRLLFTKQERCSVGHVMVNTESSSCETNPVMTITFARFQVPAGVKFRTSPDV